MARAQNKRRCRPIQQQTQRDGNWQLKGEIDSSSLAEKNTKIMLCDAQRHSNAAFVVCVRARRFRAHDTHMIDLLLVIFERSCGLVAVVCLLNMIFRAIFYLSRSSARRGETTNSQFCLFYVLVISYDDDDVASTWFA